MYSLNPVIHYIYIPAFVMWIVAVALSLFEQAASGEVRVKFLMTAVNYCVLSFPRWSLKLIQSWILLWKCEVIAVSSSVMVKHTFISCSLSVRCFETSFWKLLFLETPWIIRTWTSVCGLSWGLISEKMLSVCSACIQRNERHSLDLCFSIFLELQPLEKVTKYADPLHKIVPNCGLLRHSLV